MTPARTRALSLMSLGVLVALATGVILRVAGRSNQLLVLVPGLLGLALVVVPTSFAPALRAATGARERLWHIGAAIAFAMAPLVFITGRTTQNGALTALTVMPVTYLLLYGFIERKRARHVVPAIALALAGLNAPVSLQLPDRGFLPAVSAPTYASGQGPIVCVDQAHHNFHAVEDGLLGFVRLLERDGYRVRPLRDALSSALLAECRVLVIASAIDAADRWQLPTPSALQPSEVEATAAWIERGGALLLLVDHMPFAGAMIPMARALGFDLLNGFAMTTEPLPGFQGHVRARFSRDRGTLAAHAITAGRKPEDRVETVLSFGGAAFALPKDAEPLLTLEPSYYLVLPERAWMIDGLPRTPAGGFAQGAVKRVGRGRVAVFAEIAMFTSQLVLGLSAMPFGMNAPAARQNPQFVLNVVHWLDRESGLEP
jgi:hypothetical protein